jgi:hypothetical protein
VLGAPIQNRSQATGCGFLLMMPQPRFGQINVLLNPPQDFVVDDIFISQLQYRVAFLL